MPTPSVGPAHARSTDAACLASALDRLNQLQCRADSLDGFFTGTGLPLEFPTVITLKRRGR